MDFQTAYSLGYYFDRCIDLEFYDSNNTFMASLKTPKKGMKPSITVKGELIEGSYAISSYISIQNMAYDININAIKYIKCNMYYSGIKESAQQSYEMQKIKNGHTILFSVIYADQEKEPPNRAVRFQCTTAAFDYTRSTQELWINTNKEGKVLTPISFLSKDSFDKFKGSGNKEDKLNLIDLLETYAEAYNKLLEENNNNGGTKSLNLKDELKITAIKYPDDLKLKQVEVANGRKTIGSFLKSLNNLTPLLDESTGARYKFYVYGGVLYVSKNAPSNWREFGDEQGSKTEEELSEFYTKNYLTGKMRIRYVKNTGLTVAGEDVEENDRYGAVKLNYVKSAYRNEVVVNAVTMFDDRIYPGCYCQISGNAIMGKHRSRSSRIVNYTNENVIFRATGGIQYEFSTTEDSSMTLVGPVVTEWSGGKNSLFENIRRY